MRRAALVKQLGVNLLLCAHLTIAQTGSQGPTLPAPRKHAMGMPGMQMGDHSSPAFKVRDAWQSAWNKRDLKTMLGLYAESAIIITADGRFITGRQSISEHFQHLLAAQKNEMTLTSAGSDAAENQIVNFGSFAEEQPTRIEGATKVKFGKYLIVLRLVGSEWKIKEQVMIQSPQDARR